MTTKRITEFTFLDFMKSVEESILEGYRLDFDNIDNVPQRFGNTYECGMLKKEVEVISPMLTGKQLEQMKNESVLLMGDAQVSTLLHTGPVAEAKPIGTAVEEAPVAQLATRKGKK